MNRQLTLVIKLALIAFLLGALLKMPYGYYQLMRISVCVLFIWLAYIYYQKELMFVAIACGISVILFNPIIKLAIHKKEWQAIDLWFAIALIIWMIIDLIQLFRSRFIL
jgi:hypothetical protein